MGTVQVKNVPDELHRRLRERAAAEGQTVSDVVVDALRQVLARPSRREWFEDVARQEPVGGIDARGALRAEREEREADVDRALRRG